MRRPYSIDLRERVVRAVIKGGLSCHQAAAQFGVKDHGDSVDAAVSQDRQRQTGPDRWLQAQEDIRTASRLAGATMPDRRFHLARAGGRTRQARPEGRLQDDMGVRHAEKLSHKNRR
jgi:transposase-like protein